MKLLNPIRSAIKLLLLILSIMLFSCESTVLKPEIGSVTPGEGIPGTIVTIKGKHFNRIYHRNEVTIGGGQTKVISATDSTIRLVLLRDIATGPVIVNNLDGPVADTSTVVFNRAGTTTQATPLEDSDAELVQGLKYISNKEYDMAAQGTNQRILIVLAQPADITNPDSTAYLDTSVAATARDYIVAKAAEANTFFTQASYGKTSVDFDVTPDWIPLSQPRDFYMWTQADIDRAQNSLDGAKADMDALLLDPMATEAQVEAQQAIIDDRETKLKTAQRLKNLVQEPDFYYAEALIGAKAVMPDFDDYGDYVVICAGRFLRGSCCWREEGFHAESTILGLNLDIDFTARKGLTYVAQGTHWGRLGHELSHFFAGGDLYSNNPGNGSASRYAFMGSHDSGPLYIGYNMEKRLGYFEPSNIANVNWGSSPTFNETFDVVAHANNPDSTTDDVVNLISLKVTEGLYYHVEVRQRPDASLGAPNDYIFDQNINLTGSPSWAGGVLVSRATEDTNQNNNSDRQVELLFPQRILQVGDVVNDPARTIRISVDSKLSDRPLKYRIRVEWGTLPAPNPDGQFDLRINPWNPPPWESVDIWANSPKNDETSPAKIIYKNHETGDETKPIGNGDSPWVDNPNDLYARIRNNGTVPTPEDVKVTFYVNTPPGVGDDGNWAPFDEVNLGILPADFDTIVKANRKWVPRVGEHTCVKVQIQPMTGEITFNNNMAQENFVEFEAASGSPFRPVEFEVDVRNPYDRNVIMDMKARDVPRFWNVALEHGSIFLKANEVRRMKVVVWTDMDESAVFAGSNDDQDRKYQRKPMISIEGWVGDIPHYFFPVGGMTAFVQAVVPSEISVKPFYEQPNIMGRGSVSPKRAGVPVAV
ncbi:IPT/TIG domain-containing protein, partial [Gilvibacter sp.]|uniref:IPT/TIG domain-containing protein n=1 Tax=Gilvibacter sp. TaxID=2729997 RepID=UPI0025C28B7B